MPHTKEHTLREKRRANGHKSTCTCHICENIKNKIRKGGYEKDALKEQMKRGGYHKPNGHTPHCKCIICKHMSNKKHSRRQHSRRRGKRGGDIEDQIEASNRGETAASMDDYDAMERGDLPTMQSPSASASAMDLANDDDTVAMKKNTAKVQLNTMNETNATNKMSYKDTSDPLDVAEKGEMGGRKRTRKHKHRRSRRRTMRRR
jgi:hypothetical protein